MTPEQIDLVQTSFDSLVPIKAEAGKIFYDRLFEIAPEVRPLFRTDDMGEQGMKLMTTLGAVVNGLKDWDSILPLARDLALGHKAFGVEAKHYAPLAEALIYTFKSGLGDDFTPETEAAWRAAYDRLAGAMISFAYGDEAASA